MVIAIFLAVTVHGQSTVTLHRLWAKPQVHVKFGGYVISFKIKDVDRTLELLESTGDHTWGYPSGLDTNRQYSIELYADRQEYHYRLEKMMQNAVATFLLSVGQAEVYRGRKKLRSVIMDIQPIHGDDIMAMIKFYDPKKKRLVYSGSMPVSMYKQDIGID